MTTKIRDKTWYVYILKCADGSLYTGITIDIKRRVMEHNEAKLGAKYTRNRRPVTIVYYEMYSNRSEASKREFEIKKMSKKDKVELVGGAEGFSQSCSS